MGEKKKTPTEAFGEVIQKLRADKGLTQEALALEAGTERSHISALERAEKGPTLATILRLARALDMPAGELVRLVEQKLAERKLELARAASRA
jgi:transcriptional regulator with XRE-family HTH domain